MLMGCSSQELITALSTHKIQLCERGHCCHKFDIIAAVTSAAMLIGCSSQELITALSTHKIQPCERGHCCHKFDIIAGN
ncbi:unnamed protein product [Trifolium pratense]|uniref:Uncharacterized protein n=1 Tax=Trifolium pratense TaxID=57577 RepID=A0ACB0JMJ6_TRIPR|nr:unnamed protein product [Trifolium pratense]